MGAQPGDWCILRTSGQKTLALARSLDAAGFSVWTPIDIKNRRRPRCGKMVEYELPVMPTFVFARAQHIWDLFRCLGQPVNPHPSFSIFHHRNRVPLISEAEMASLRNADEKAKRIERERQSELKSKRRDFVQGQYVNVPDGPFQGLTGIVEECDGKFAMVAFKGSRPIKIASWLLEADGVEANQLYSGIAA